ncbi:MAG: serine/threonine protein kinase [Candidatus Eremiobacteraeota bacterium]|nr:serine/threonine protein kinase [Candidatus Eremiobacteraeota bacterium]
MSGEILADRYIIGKIVGEGSYSIVFKGWDKEKKRIVAVKELKRSGMTSGEIKESRDLFFREINILKSLNHPSFPKVYDFLCYDERYYLVMEWVNGEDLLSLLKRKFWIPEDIAIGYMKQILKALIYLQDEKRNIIYKDLKPSNIILTGTGQLKIIDFGAARFYSPGKKKDTHALGTPGYASPEAYTGRQTDFSADMYSLGATFYHLVTGMEPVCFKFKFPSPKKFNGNLSDGFSKFLIECLKLGDKRIPDAKSASDRLSGIMGIDYLPGDKKADKNKNLERLFVFSCGIIAFFVLTSVIFSSGFFYNLLNNLSPFLQEFAALILGMFFSVCVLYGAIGILIKRLPKGFDWSSLRIIFICFCVCSFIVPYFSRARAPYPGSTSIQCQQNCKNIAHALDIYARENNGHYPENLGQLTPKYIRAIPTCTTAKKETYTSSYHTNRERTSFTFYCNGENHRNVGVEGNFPKFDSYKGILCR